VGVSTIHTEIDDFNPKSAAIPIPADSARYLNSANNEQFVADFLFGAHSNYQLNNAVIVNYRQRMQFVPSG
jgi:hypothetical protein